MALSGRQLVGAELNQQQLTVSNGSTELSLNQLHHSGFRQHNSAEKRQASLRQSQELADDLQLNWRYDWSDDPLLQDPLGLTPVEWRQDPQQTASVARLFNSQKNSAQRQLSATLQPLDGHWQWSTWHGQRDIRQLLAFSGDAISSAGGVVALQRHFRGLKAQQQWQQQRWWLQASAQLDQHTDQRQGYVNLRGVIGDLRRDETGKVQSVEMALRSEYQTEVDWLLSAGLRLSQLKFNVRDDFIRPGNPDDSGQRQEQHPSFALGASYPLTEALSFYLSAGQGFETPTLTEMAYRQDGIGLDLDLRSARHQQFDSGLKYLQQHHSFTVDLFYQQSQDELVVAQSVGGRTSYRNADYSQRRGLELSWQQQISAHWQQQLSSSYLDSRFRPDGTFQATLPGVAKQQHSWSLQFRPWQDDRWRLASQLSYRSKVYVDDANRQAAPAVTLLKFDSRWQLQQQQSRWQFWLSLDNALNSKYVAAVVVNQANGRSFEPAPQRQWQAGVGFSWLFSAPD